MIASIRRFLSKSNLRPRTRMERREALVGLVFISPWVVGLVLLKLIPIVVSLGFSFTDFDMLHPGDTEFIGLRNYAHILEDLFSEDGAAGYYLFNTVGFAIISVPAQLLTALGLAVLLNSQRLAAKELHRTLVFLPSVVPGAAIAFVWFGFLDPTTGWLNRLLLEPLGLPPYPGPMSEAGYNLFRVITALWSIGPGFLIMLGAMRGVPPELYEAAQVAGAGPIMRLLTVTVPIISPAIFFSLVINLVSVFGGVTLLDRGTSFSGGGQSPFDFYIGQVMFTSHQLGYAASLAWMMFIIMLVTTITLFATARYWVYYPDGDEA
ncbi:MAG: sugar ABC transporter permease [Chloroflexota bacterium]